MQRSLGRSGTNLRESLAARKRRSCVGRSAMGCGRTRRFGQLRTQLCESIQSGSAQGPSWIAVQGLCMDRGVVVRVDLVHVMWRTATISPTSPSTWTSTNLPAYNDLAHVFKPSPFQAARKALHPAQCWTNSSSWTATRRSTSPGVPSFLDEDNVTLRDESDCSESQWIMIDGSVLNGLPKCPSSVSHHLERPDPSDLQLKKTTPPSGQGCFDGPHRGSSCWSISSGMPRP